MKYATKSQRTNSLNPNNLAYEAAVSNHADQLNRNSPAYIVRMNNHANQLNPNNPLCRASQPKLGSRNLAWLTVDQR